jgi:hypothetical protein
VQRQREQQQPRLRNRPNRRTWELTFHGSPVAGVIRWAARCTMVRAAIVGLVVIVTIVAIGFYADSQHHVPRRLVVESATR